MAIFLTQSGCSPDITDDARFHLYYYNALVTMGEDYYSTPSYIGAAPHSFEIYDITYEGQVYYNPKLDGALTEKSHFYVNPENGGFFVNQTKDMKAGTYLVSIRCISDGVTYDNPDILTVKLSKVK